MTKADLANLRIVAEHQAAMERDGVWPTEDDTEMFAAAFDAVTCLRLLDQIAELRSINFDMRHLLAQNVGSRAKP
jgi:hypothetical protein